MKYLIIILSVTLFCCKDRKHAQPASTTRDTGYALYVNPLPSVAGSNKLVNLIDSLKGNSYGAFTRDGKMITSDSLPTTIDMGGYLISVDTTKGWFKHFNYKSRGSVGLDTTWPTVYSNKAKIVDSGNVVLNPDTVTKWFRGRFDTAGATYEFFEITITETMKGKYKVLCYLKPDSAWVIKDSIALLKWFLNDLVQKYSPMHKFPVTKDSIDYPYNVR